MISLDTKKVVYLFILEKLMNKTIFFAKKRRSFKLMFSKFIYTRLLVTVSRVSISCEEEVEQQ